MSWKRALFTTSRMWEGKLRVHQNTVAAAMPVAEELVLFPRWGKQSRSRRRKRRRRRRRMYLQLLQLLLLLPWTDQPLHIDGVISY
jgi:hypothetical protein